MIEFKESMQAAGLDPLDPIEMIRFDIDAKGDKAALAVGGVVAVPGLGRKADAWDLWNERGADAVRAAIEAAAPVADERDGQQVGTDEGGGLYLLDEVCS